MSGTDRPSPTLTIFRKEVRELLRDRRAVFFAFVLPLFLYPLMFLGMSTLPRMYQERLESKALLVGVSGVETPFESLIEPGDALEVSRAEPDEASLRDGTVGAFVEFRPAGPPDAADAVDAPEAGDPADPAGEPQLEAVLHYLGSQPASREALSRVRSVLERLEDMLVEERFAARQVEIDVGRLVLTVSIDTSSAEDRSAVGLGRFLPTLLMLLLLTGGAFAAIDLVAGEKERQTLETLWVQAVSPGQIIAGKFLVVLLSSLASVALNLVGLLVAVLLGLAPDGFGGGAFVLPPASSLALVLVLLVPFAVLSSAVLMTLSSYARSYREAQTYLLPLTLVVLVPVGLAAAPQVNLASIVAVVPVANVALATREAVSGDLGWVSMAVVFLSTCLYAVVALRKARQLLGREEVLLAIESPPLASDASVEGRARRAVAFGAVALLIAYFLGGWFQGSSHFDFAVGTALTLWVAVLGSAVLYPIVTRRRLADALALRRTSPWNIAFVLPLGLATTVLAAGYMQVQEVFLPFPQDLARALEERIGIGSVHPIVMFLVFALSPGICEELLWRGAFQGDLEPRRRPVRTALLVGFFFGVFHFSIHRLVPTALVGVVLAGVRHRTRSLWPCIVLHTTHNAVTLFGLGKLEEGGQLDALIGDSWVLSATAIVAALCFWQLRRPHRVRA